MELDELGIPRLRELLRETLEQPNLRFGGEWMDEPPPTVAYGDVVPDTAPAEADSELQEDGTSNRDSEPTEHDGSRRPVSQSTAANSGKNGRAAAPGPERPGGQHKAAGKESDTDGATSAAVRSEERGRWLVLVSGEGGVRGSGSTEQTLRRSATDIAGIAEVLRYETEHGREPEEMPHENPGYDVRSRDESGEIVRFIEVKSISSSWEISVVQLTSTQFDKAQEVRERFWLYVVEYAGSPKARVRAIQDPASAATRFVFDHGWRARDEATDGPPLHETSEVEQRLDAATTALRAVVDAGGAAPKVPL